MKNKIVFEKIIKYNIVKEDLPDLHTHLEELNRKL